MQHTRTHGVQRGWALLHHRTIADRSLEKTPPGIFVNVLSFDVQAPFQL